jgi:uncharacterized CHY-type Zn-finger protein
MSWWRADQCPACKDYLNKGKLNQHRKFKCRKRTILCNICDKNIIYEDYRSHHDNCTNTFELRYQKRLKAHQDVLADFVNENVAKVIINYLIPDKWQQYGYKI